MEGDQETGGEFEKVDGRGERGFFSSSNMMTGVWPALSSILDDWSPPTRARPMEIRGAMPRHI